MKELNLWAKKYKSIIKFYREAKDKSKLDAAFKEIQITKKFLDEMNYFWKLDFDNYKENEVMNEIINKLK